MLLYALIAGLLPAALAVTTPCLPSGDETAINSALTKGGKGATVTLCPGSVHRLNSTIYFTAPRQTLTTEGNPTGRDRALLVVEGPDQATAVQADCKKCSGAVIRSLEVDGNRPNLLRVKLGGALLELGNADDQMVRDCRLYEPRGWSALHFREGDDKQCTRGTILNNEIGPCGEEWDDDYDGVVELGLAAPWGFPRADGISLACKDSTVKRNIIYDATDGAIVLFGSSGSIVSHNQIFSRTRVILGGINLVDYPPWEGDYTRVIVQHNTLTAHGGYIKAGIVIGTASWSDDTETTVYGATVTDNQFRGGHFGYGLVVSSAKDFTVLRNTVSDDAAFSGVPGPKCPRAPGNGKPTAFLINRGSSEGVYQDNFVNGEVQYIICIDPVPVRGQPYKPWRLRDAPQAIALKQASDPKSQAIVNARVADALVKYQSTLLAHLQLLSDRLDSVDPSAQVAHTPQALSGDQIAVIMKRIDALEKGEKKVRAEVEGVREDWGTMSEEWKRSSTDQKPILEYIFRSVTSLDHTSDSQSPRANLANSIQNGLGGQLSGTLATVGAFGAMVVGASVLVRRWRGRRDKGAKIR
ncbi:pectin lyase fold/virulence factor [Dioszegia hungarica]|uniref:Pectin lyase fold/virulence factor n=1 Tax=Dioszegia hungarica TaxID=4972 RepID=A0AA38H1H7_9TREE|nr:pectin lyase fold/virulence factor [Dioszegia hungarica]KAI9631985.1 pectin lyase fold/virulence factor [Dioszegia hungarica]